MPPNNKKKKKPAANPARGFTTVSTPSRPKPAEPTDAPTAADDPKTATDNGKQPPAEEQQQPSIGEEATPSLQQYSPEELEKHLEDSELQLLVDKYAAKCKNDAARQVTKLETDRRVLRQQATSLNLMEWIPSDVQDQIISLAETEEMETGPLRGKELSGVKRSSSSEDLSVKLWTLRETLLKLGFPESKVDDSLRYLLAYSTGGATSANRDTVWNLDESLDWLAMHCSLKELPSYTQTNAQLPKESENTISWIAGKPRLLNPFDSERNKLTWTRT